jgi:hypothetical protein
MHDKAIYDVLVYEKHLTGDSCVCLFPKTTELMTKMSFPIVILIVIDTLIGHRPMPINPEAAG